MIMPENIDDLPAVDLVYLNEYAANDKAFIKELVVVFLETSSEHMATLKANILDGENKSWSEAAHSLKGSAAFLGAEKMRLLCAQGQHMLTASADERAALYNQIQESYRNVLAFLDAYCSNELQEKT